MAFDKMIGVGIDLGSSNLLVHVEKQGVVFNEPSVIAFDRETGRVVAAGMAAYEMLGKSSERIAVIKPLKDGVVADMKAAKALLTHVFSKLDYLSAKDLGRIRTMICCPSDVSSIDRDVIRNLAVSMGMGTTYVDEEIKSAAVGVDFDIDNATGVMVIDMGGGTTDVGVLSKGDIVLSRSLKLAGNYLDELIMDYVKQVHKVEIGERTAERIKVTLGTLDPAKPDVTERFAGRDCVRGLPRWITISSSEVREVVRPIYEEYTKLITAVLENTPEEIKADIYRNGITLCGGGALMDGAAKFVSEQIKLPVKLAGNAITCVAEGTKQLLDRRPL